MMNPSEGSNASKEVDNAGTVPSRSNSGQNLNAETSSRDSSDNGAESPNDGDERKASSTSVSQPGPSMEEEKSPSEKDEDEVKVIEACSSSVSQPGPSMEEEKSPSEKDEDELEVIEACRKIIPEIMNIISNVNEALLSVEASLERSCIPLFVREIVFYSLEDKSEGHDSVGELIVSFMKEGDLTASQLVSELSGIIEFAVDCIPDVPEVWKYLADLLVPVIEADKLTFKDISSAVCEMRGTPHITMLLANLIQPLVKNKGPNWFRNHWESHDVKWIDFIDLPEDVEEFLSSNNLSFMNTSEENAKKLQKIDAELTEILHSEKNATVSEIRKWTTDLLIENEQIMEGLVDLIFNKAADEPNFCKTYVEMCCLLEWTKVHVQTEGSNRREEVIFREVLISKCQKEFQKNVAVELNKDEKLKEIENETDLERKAELQLNFQKEEESFRRRSCNIVRFVHDLFKIQLLPVHIMTGCVVELLAKSDELSYERLCFFFTTIGRLLEERLPPGALDFVFQQIEAVADKENKGTNISSRVQGMLLEVIELRGNKWTWPSCDTETLEYSTDVISPPNTPRKRRWFPRKRGGRGGRAGNRGGRGNENNLVSEDGRRDETWKSNEAGTSLPDTSGKRQYPYRKRGGRMGQDGPGGSGRGNRNKSVAEDSRHDTLDPNGPQTSPQASSSRMRTRQWYPRKRGGRYMGRRQMENRGDSVSRDGRGDTLESAAGVSGSSLSRRRTRKKRGGRDSGSTERRGERENQDYLASGDGREVHNPSHQLRSGRDVRKLRNKGASSMTGSAETSDKSSPGSGMLQPECCDKLPDFPRLERGTSVDAIREWIWELFSTLGGVLCQLEKEEFDKVRQLSVPDLPSFDNVQMMEKVIDHIFHKAVDEPDLSEAYAEMCYLLQHKEAPVESEGTDASEKVNFRETLEGRCQQELECSKVVDLNRDEKMKKIEGEIDPEKKKELQLILEREEGDVRSKSATFIGKLFKKQMLPVDMMLQYVRTLLAKNEHQSIECLCRLLMTIGGTLEERSPPMELDAIFQELQELAEKGRETSAVESMLREVIDLRRKKWISRLDDTPPVAMEQQKQFFNMAKIYYQLRILLETKPS